jgi:hypothetical protein
MLKAVTILTFAAGVGSAAATKKQTRKLVEKRQFERALSGSGDIEFDDDFWGYDQGSMDVVWDEYSINPKKCMI